MVHQEPENHIFELTDSSFVEVSCDYDFVSSINSYLMGFACVGAFIILLWAAVRGTEFGIESPILNVALTL